METTETGDYIEFEGLQEQLNFREIPLFIGYLKELFNDLSEKFDEKSIKRGVTKIKFFDYMKIPLIISDKLFSVFDKDKDDLLSSKEFIIGFQELYTGDFDSTLRIIFDLLDFNKDGFIEQDDVKVLMSYLPLKTDNSKVEYKYQMKSLNEINIIVNETFSGNKKLNYEKFENAIKTTKSDIFLHILCFLYQKVPFKNSNISLFRASKKVVSHCSEKDLIGKYISEKNLKKGYKSHQSTKLLLNSVKSSFLGPIQTMLSLKSGESGEISSFTESSNTPQMAGIDGMIRMRDSTRDAFKLEEKIENTIKDYQEVLSNEVFLNNNLLPSKILEEQHSSSSSSSEDEDEDNKSPKKEGNSKSNNLQDSPKKKKEKSENKEDKQKDEKDTKKEKTSPKKNEKKVSFSPDKKRYTGKDLTSNILHSSVKTIKPKSEKNLVILCNLNTEEKTLYENYIYKICSSEDKLFKYYLCVNGKEIFYYSDDKKTNLLGMHNLTGCYLKKGGFRNINDTKFYIFEIQFPSKNREFYTPDKNIAKDFIKYIKKGIGYENFFDYYDMSEDIGQGKFGLVKLGINKKTKERVAIKVIKKSKIKKKDAPLVRTEIEIMKICHHPNVVRLLDYFENYEYIFIVMEYLAGGDLISYLKNIKSKIVEKKAAELIFQLGLGIKYLQQFGVVHRDLKPANIMLTKTEDMKQLKIMDFGLSIIMSPTEVSRDGCGTLIFIAPEVLLRKPYNKQVDIWSIGVILYFMLSGIFPFDDDSDDEEKIAKKIVYEDFEFPEKEFEGCSSEAKDLISNCLIKEPSKRLTIRKFLEHKWFKKYGLSEQSLKI